MKKEENRQVAQHTVDFLAAAAKVAREKAYCPYSNFAVGAALMTVDGELYYGANIENASYTPTLCAERVAFAKAISEGKRDFAAIAIAGGPADKEAEEIVPPCGVCRQVMAEFCDEDFTVILAAEGKVVVKTLGELYPYGFSKDSL